MAIESHDEVPWPVAPPNFAAPVYCPEEVLLNFHRKGQSEKARELRPCGVAWLLSRLSHGHGLSTVVGSSRFCAMVAGARGDWPQTALWEASGASAGARKEGESCQELARFNSAGASICWSPQRGRGNGGRLH